MNYTLHQLKVFYEIAENQSITRASEALFLSQPAVSIQLKKFQDQFDIPLTEVIGRQLYVTDFGKEIAQVAKNILDQAEEIRYKTLAYQGELVGQLKIAVVSTAKYVMPYFLYGFLRKHTGVDLVMDVTNKATVLANLDKNTVDFTLMSTMPESDQIERMALMKNKLVLVVSPKLMEVDGITSRNVLEQLPLIFREPGSSTRNAMEDFLSKNDIYAKKKIELTSNEAVKQATIAGLGSSIMPLIGIRNELEKGDLRIIRLPGLPIVSTWYLAWLKNKKFSPAAQAYLEYIEQEKDEIIQQEFIVPDEM
ncbi:MAG: LysR family transcriptional regulator PycR [Roseivirga sp.]